MCLPMGHRKTRFWVKAMENDPLEPIITCGCQMYTHSWIDTQNLHTLIFVYTVQTFD